MDFKSYGGFNIFRNRTSYKRLANSEAAREKNVHTSVSCIVLSFPLIVFYCEFMRILIGPILKKSSQTGCSQCHATDRRDMENGRSENPESFSFASRRAGCR